jgi:SsrA-binding protein
MKEGAEAGEKLIATNRKARHEYTVLDTFEAGIVLKGPEVKSLRRGNANLSDGYVMIREGEAWLVGTHISPYEQGSYANVEPTRNRKLLLHKQEIRKFLARTKERGLTLIPLKMYFKNGVAKVLVGLAHGKTQYDKRHDIAKREAERTIRQRLAR